MDDFDDDNIIDDVATLKVSDGASEAATSCEQPGDAAEDASSNLLKTRTYDLSITYDKYYQTPRVWLIGYDKENRKLEPVKCLEDVSHEHARKTVTIDEHPCLDVMAASIHPCKHANVMKRITDMMVEGALCNRSAVLLLAVRCFFLLRFRPSSPPTVVADPRVRLLSRCRRQESRGGALPFPFSQVHLFNYTNHRI